MTQDEHISVRSIYTIGHSNHSMETFLDLLKSQQIEVLIDTRSSPFSRFSPQFNRDSLKAAVQKTGIKYGFYGRYLGGRPEDEGLYDEAGHVDYSQVAKSFLFKEGLERLVSGFEKFRTALLCSEENPSICHRRLLISRVLFEQGIDVYHIRGNGIIQSEQELRDQEEEKNSRQPGLFEEKEAVAWKSIQSVLHKVRPHGSSDG
ncbi:MAG: DUF488 domain-containing protein [Janthinobacterium lividum]